MISQVILLTEGGVLNQLIRLYKLILRTIFLANNHARNPWSTHLHEPC